MVKREKERRKEGKNVRKKERKEGRKEGGKRCLLIVVFHSTLLLFFLNVLFWSHLLNLGTSLEMSWESVLSFEVECQGKFTNTLGLNTASAPRN